MGASCVRVAESLRERWRTEALHGQASLGRRIELSLGHYTGAVCVGGGGGGGGREKRCDSVCMYMWVCTVAVLDLSTGGGGLSPQIKIKALRFQYKYTPQNNSCIHVGANVSM